MSVPLAVVLDRSREGCWCRDVDGMRKFLHWMVEEAEGVRRVVEEGKEGK